MPKRHNFPKLDEDPREQDHGTEGLQAEGSTFLPLGTSASPEGN